MLHKFIKAAAMTFAGAAMLVGTNASAAIIGSANYASISGDVFDPGPSGLELLLDGFSIWSLASPGAAVGTPISLATSAPGAFAALAAVLRNNIENDITTSAFPGHTIPAVETISDFNYSVPLGTDDLPGSGTIVDVIVTINLFKTSAVQIPGIGSIWTSEYNIDIEVEAIPVPGAFISGASGIALLGVIAYRRRQRA